MNKKSANISIAKAPTLSQRQLFWRRLRRHRGSLISLSFIVLMIVIVVVGPMISPYDFAQQNLTDSRKPPSLEHWLGTDSTGRDVLIRLMHAGRISLMVGFCAAFLEVTIGLLVGTAAGWFGGIVDAVLSRVIDIMLSIPGVLVILVVAGVVGTNTLMLILILGLLGWAGSARIARAVTLSLRQEEYVQAGKVLGSSNWFIISKHLVPGVLPPIIVAATLAVAGAILAEAALSFLGAGVQPPEPSWGNMLIEAQSLTVLSTMPWLWVPPGVAVALTVLAAMTLGDGLREAIDTKNN